MNLEYLRNKIDNSPFTNEDVANLMGVSRATLFNYKFGKNDIPATKLDKLVKLLNLNLEELFGGK